jgi:hypothetical protein
VQLYKFSYLLILQLSFLPKKREGEGGGGKGGGQK